jgi:protein phosphatase
MTRLVGAGRSDVGLKRENNEDSFFLDNDQGLFVVADGMGGAASGELASQLVAQTLAEYVRLYADAPADAPERFDYHDDKLTSRGNTLMQAVHLANRLVYDAARKNPRHKGMGSTLAVVMQDDDAVLVLNVGDSRVLRSRNGNLEQITVDHRFQDDPAIPGSHRSGSHHP